MKFKMEVIAVEATGDNARVTMEGQYNGAADWRPYLKWVVEMPVHAVKSYRIGQAIRAEIKP